MTSTATKKIRVGVIGASPGAAWATLAHLPALRALPAFEVTAVSTTRRASAEETAASFGVPHAFDHAAHLIEHPDVDLVVVSVRAPGHAELVRAAIEARKDVLCEWPLGVSLAETVELAERAERAGVRTAIGLQRRLTPGVRYLRHLLAKGAIGKLRSVSLHATVPLLGTTRPKAYAYTADYANGVNVLHTVTAHLLDPLLFAAGEPVSLSAVVARQFDETMLAETGERLPVTSPDQVLVSGTLPGGAVLSVHVETGKRSGGAVRQTITGTDGDLALTPEYALEGTYEAGAPLMPLEVPDAFTWVPRADLPDHAYEIAHVYSAFAKDRAEGTRLTPTFQDAVRLHRLVERIREAADLGRRLEWKG